MINPDKGITILTDFIHQPYKTIYVRDIIKMTLDDLLNMMSTLETGNAYWVDGVLFASFAMTDSEELAKKEIQGETYLDKIIFAKYERYTKTAKSSTNLEINILNVQKSQLYRDLIKWLKQQPIWNE
ncbi:MAG: hypothetical protein K5785_02650 [Nitrosarchaeum sp.]|nr:hypothetical protein [Nitrosarchaeum sp.]